MVLFRVLVMKGGIRIQVRPDKCGTLPATQEIQLTIVQGDGGG